MVFLAFGISGILYLQHWRGSLVDKSCFLMLLFFSCLPLGGEGDIDEGKSSGDSVPLWHFATVHSGDSMAQMLQNPPPHLEDISVKILHSAITER